MGTTPKIKRGRGRPPVVDGAVVSVNLRLSVADRDALRRLGGASWVRSQIAAARQAGALLAVRQADADRATGLTPQAVHNSVKRVQTGRDLALAVTKE